MSFEKRQYIVREGGITLIELCVFILIVGICAAPIIMMLNYSLRSSAVELIMTTAIGLAEGKMEELVAEDFYTLRQRYRDDSDNTITGNFEGDFANYQYSVTIKPINPAYTGDFADTAAVVSGTKPYGNFSRVYLEVWNTSLPSKRVKLYTIITPHKY